MRIISTNRRHHCDGLELRQTRRCIVNIHALSPLAERQSILTDIHQHTLCSLKAAFNTAVRWQAVKVNPFLSCKTVPAPGMKPAFMSITDIERLLARMSNGTLRDFVIFAINTGARRGEILSLKWDAVDIEHRFIVIRATDKIKTKTGRDRTIPLTDGAMSVIARRRTTVSGEYIFSVNGKTITHRFKKAVRAAGLSEAIHVHSLRHSCASLLMQSRASITAVKELLGHSTIATTQIYTHNTAESLRREIEKIPTLVPYSLVCREKPAKDLTGLVNQNYFMMLKHFTSEKFPASNL